MVLGVCFSSFKREKESLGRSFIGWGRGVGGLLIV